jgi:hypothetical protein
MSFAAALRLFFPVFQPVLFLFGGALFFVFQSFLGGGAFFFLSGFMFCRAPLVAEAMTAQAAVL